jgi:hypothetical protein
VKGPHHWRASTSTSSEVQRRCWYSRRPTMYVLGLSRMAHDGVLAEICRILRHHRGRHAHLHLLLFRVLHHPIHPYDVLFPIILQIWYIVRQNAIVIYTECCRMYRDTSSCSRTRWRTWARRKQTRVSSFKGELSVVYREYLEGFERCEPSRSDSA